MKISVSRKDIIIGREHITHGEGCPIWHALKRALGLTNGDDLSFIHYDEARLGKKFAFYFPEQVVDWQKNAVLYPHETLKPISFDADINVF